MTHDDIDSPGLVPNSHRLRQEVLRACSYAANLGSSEKAVELISFFRQAMVYLEREVLSECDTGASSPIVDPEAVSPFTESDVKEKKVAKKSK